ncbi:MAG: hypothetical protein LBR89_01780 [Holosporales bacterium]|jgi:hypothetical protein|nr:hypothetical protein [Holosporales bacterium]
MFRLSKLLLWGVPLILVGCDGLKKKPTQSGGNQESTQSTGNAVAAAGDTKADAKAEPPAKTDDAAAADEAKAEAPAKTDDADAAAADDAKTEAPAEADDADDTKAGTPAADDTEAETPAKTDDTPASDASESTGVTSSDTTASSDSDKPSSEADKSTDEPNTDKEADELKTDKKADEPQADKSTDAPKADKKADAPAKEQSADEPKANNETDAANVDADPDVVVKAKIEELKALNAKTSVEWIKNNVATLVLQKVLFRRDLRQSKDKADKHFWDTFPQFIAANVVSFIPLIGDYTVEKVKLEATQKKARRFVLSMKNKKTGESLAVTVMTTGNLRIMDISVQETSLVALLKTCVSEVEKERDNKIAKWDEVINNASANGA